MKNFTIGELQMLLKGLEQLSGNNYNWNLQKRINNEIELEKNDNMICHFESEVI